MNPLVSRLMESATAPLRQAVASAARAAMMGIVALLLLFTGVGFLTAAGYMHLRFLYGPLDAALIVGAIFVVLAMIVVVVLAMGGGRPAPRASMQAAPARAASPPPAGDQLAAGIADALSRGRAGGGEQLAMLAGTELGRQLRPFHLVALAFIGGLIAGRRIDRPK
jgi:hypothetical protein